MLDPFVGVGTRPQLLPTLNYDIPAAEFYYFPFIADISGESLQAITNWNCLHLLIFFAEERSSSLPIFLVKSILIKIISHNLSLLFLLFNVCPHLACVYGTPLLFSGRELLDFLCSSLHHNIREDILFLFRLWRLKQGLQDLHIKDFST